MVYIPNYSKLQKLEWINPKIVFILRNIFIKIQNSLENKYITSPFLLNENLKNEIRVQMT